MVLVHEWTFVIGALDFNARFAASAKPIPDQDIEAVGFVSGRWSAVGGQFA